MERSRSKRSYNDFDSDRSRPHFNHHYNNDDGGGNRNSHRHNGRGVRTSAPPPLSSEPPTTQYRILCQDATVGGVIGKSGSVIKSIRQHTGAWINVHELVPGDEERIIEITDNRRRGPDGRMPAFSPAQEALILVHERILKCEMEGGGGGAVEEDEDYYGGGGGSRGGGTRVVTRLVVMKKHVGSLLGKGGKIIEKMRKKTRTYIRVLTRDQKLPRCVSAADEVVQVTGDLDNVKDAVEIIASRLRESQHRDHSQFTGPAHSPDRFFPPDDDCNPHMNNAGRKSSMSGSGYRSRSSGNRNYGSRSSGYMLEPGSSPMDDNVHPYYGENLVFRILCPVDRVGLVLGESDGIMELLQNEIGVDFKAADPVGGADEQIIMISSEEALDDELFPAQEALLHIQTRIVDLVLDKENIISTRLLVPSSDIVCLEGKEGSLSDIRRLTGAHIHILSREGLPPCVSENDMLLQIVGEIKAARDALVEVTSRLRSRLYRDVSQKDAMQLSSHGPGSSAQDYIHPVHEAHTGIGVSRASYQEVQNAYSSKDSEVVKNNENKRHEDVPTGLNSSIPVKLVTRSILEVDIPEKAASKLITKSKNTLARISELSGARVTLVEDSPEVSQVIKKSVQISGTPEQTERAQSLLQGFILSTQDES